MESDILNVMKESIGNTSFVELKDASLPNGNRIFAKLEYENPTESHYDRVYAELFSSLESEGKIERRKTKLVEVSSGTAAISFAWFCSQLGYLSKVILPNIMAKKFFSEYINEPTEIIISQKNKYVSGAVDTLKEFLVNHKDYYAINHSRREISLLGTERIGKEISEFFDKQGIKPDYFFPACGNGISILGPGRILKKNFPNMKIVTFEDENAPVGYKIKYPELYQEKFGKHFINKPHHLFGTSAWGVYFPFIMDEKYEFNKLVDDVLLIKDLDWWNYDEELQKSGFNVGSTSLASYLVAKRISQEVSNKIFVIIFYDKRSKYF